MLLLSSVELRALQVGNITNILLFDSIKSKIGQTFPEREREVSLNSLPPATTTMTSQTIGQSDMVLRAG